MVSVPDARKGEQLVLVTDCPDADRDDLVAHAKRNGLTELMVPKTIVHEDKVPLLGSGKIDYQAVAELVKSAAA